MIRMPGDTYTRQKWLVVAVLLILFIAPIAQALSWYAFEWPAFQISSYVRPGWDHYSERMVLLKYLITLSLSIIGATWYLITSGKRGVSSDDPDSKLLSWAWTLLGIAILSGFVEIYLTYKDYHYWPRIAEQNYYDSRLTQMRHCGYTRALHMSFYITLWSFFVGGVVLMFAVIRLLHKKQPTELGQPPAE